MEIRMSLRKYNKNIEQFQLLAKKELFNDIDIIINRKLSPTKHTEHHIRYKRLIKDLRELKKKHLGNQKEGE